MLSPYPTLAPLVTPLLFCFLASLVAFPSMPDLGSYCQCDDVARAFYQYLFHPDRNLDKYESFQCSRPITDQYAELQRLNITLLQRYLSFLCMSEGEASNSNVAGAVLQISATDLLRNFNKWAQDNSYTFQLNSTSLGTELKALREKGNPSGIARKRGGGQSQYTFSFKHLREFLQNQNLFDKEAVG